MKSLVLMTLLFATASQAQNLSTYERVFPKKYSPEQGLISLVELSAAGLGVLMTESGTTRSKEFWAKVFPAEHLAIENQQLAVNRLTSQRGENISYELEQSINQSKSELAALKRSYDLKKLEELEKLGFEANNIRSTLNKIKVFGIIRKGVLIYLVVDATTRLCVAMSDRNPGMFAAPKLLPIAAADLKTLFN
jgi:hypothetical protein